MPDPGPTVVAVEIDSAWVVALGVSVVTLLAAAAARRFIARPGGLASGLLLALPLVLPPVAALAFDHAALPEVTVLTYAPEALRSGGHELVHLLFLSPDGRTWIPYAFSGRAGAWILALGAGVSGIMLLRRLAGAWVLRRLVARCRPMPADSPARSVLTVLSLRAGLRAPPELLLLPPGVTGVLAVGLRRPRVLVSEGLLARLDADELRGVLAHEVAHLAARDLPLTLGAGLLRDFAAWNPFSHAAFRKLLRDRELEADRRAVTLTGQPLPLASGLIKAYELTRGARGAPAGGLALIRRRSGFAHRVARLVELADARTAPPVAGTALYLAAALVVAAVGLQVGARIASQDEAVAFVWGAPAPVPAERVEVDPGRTTPDNRRRAGQERRAEQAGGGIEDVLRSPAVRAGLAVSGDIDRLSRQVRRLASRLGVPLSEFQFRARPLELLSRGPFGLYRIDPARPAGARTAG